MLGYILLLREFHPAPVFLGFVLEENFRRTMVISHEDLRILVERPISAVPIGLCALLIAGQIYVRLRSMAHDRRSL